MSALPPGLRNLSRRQRMDLAQLLIESVEAEPTTLTDDQLTDLRIRIAQFDADPDEGQTLEEFIATDGRTP